MLWMKGFSQPLIQALGHQRFQGFSQLALAMSAALET